MIQWLVIRAWLRRGLKHCEVTASSAKKILLTARRFVCSHTSCCQFPPSTALTCRRLIIAPPPPGDSWHRRSQRLRSSVCQHTAPFIHPHSSLFFFLFSSYGIPRRDAASAVVVFYLAVCICLSGMTEEVKSGNKNADVRFLKIRK